MRPSLFELFYCLVDIVRYKKKKIKVFVTDTGHQYYFYYKKRVYYCENHNSDYSTQIKKFIDARIREQLLEKN